MGEGPRFVAGGTETRLVGPSSATRGAYCVLDQIVPPGFVSPTHRHASEDQVAFVLEGTLGFWIEGNPELEVGAGSFVSRPRNLLHALWNPSDRPSRMLEITSPGEAFERWVWELHELVERVGLDRAALIEVGARYGITYAQAGEGPARKDSWLLGTGP